MMIVLDDRVVLSLAPSHRTLLLFRCYTFIPLSLVMRDLFTNICISLTTVSIECTTLQAIRI